MARQAKEGGWSTFTIYRQASTLRGGQCVLVTGELRGAASLLENSKVCDLDYFLQFESIEPCP